MTVRIFDEHAEVLPHWWAEGGKARTVVYLDAHLDLQPCPVESVAMLRACTTVDEVRGLARPHPLVPGNQHAYGLEDWLLPAHRIGAIEHLVWVVPPHIGVRFDSQAFAQLSQLEGVQADDLCSFRRTREGAIVGALLGVPVTMCSLDQVPALGLPTDVVVDVDADYFVVVPGDTTWTTPPAVCEVLRRSFGPAAKMTVSRSVSSGFMPLRYRFFADWLASLWQEDVVAAAHYARVHALDSAASLEPSQVITDAVLEEQRAFPDCAATAYLLARLTLAPEERASWQARASMVASDYRPDVLREACSYRHRRLDLALGRVHELRRALSAGDLASKDLALAQVAVGLLYAAFGRVTPALECLLAASDCFGEHPELALEIGKLQMRSGDTEAAAPLLRVALGDHKWRGQAAFLLGQLLAQQGRLDEASSLLADAAQRAPAWADVHRAAAAVAMRRGDASSARRHGATADALATSARRLERQLAPARELR